MRVRLDFDHLSSRKRSDIYVPLHPVDVTYVTATTVGTQTFSLIVDTGSSNTWVGAGTKYKKSSSGTKTSGTVSVSYGSGSFSGTEYTDTVCCGFD